MFGVFKISQFFGKAKSEAEHLEQLAVGEVEKVFHIICPHCNNAMIVAPGPETPTVPVVAPAAEVARDPLAPAA